MVAQMINSSKIHELITYSAKVLLSTLRQRQRHSPLIAMENILWMATAIGRAVISVLMRIRAVWEI